MARRLKNWISAYLHYTKHTEAPREFHFWTAVSTIAGALQGKVWLDMTYFVWKPNFFIVFVAPPGVVNKSTTFGVGMDMLRRCDGVHFGPSSTTWQALTEALQESCTSIPLDTTAQNGDIINGTYLDMCCLTLEASEFGTLIDPSNREMLDVLVDLWDGKNKPWVRRTRSGGEEVIPNPWINIVGGTTPAWIAENMSEYVIGGGFTSRTIFVYGDHKHQLIPYPHLEVNRDNLKPVFDDLINDLQEITNLIGCYNLTEEAYEFGMNWYYKHWEETPEHLKSERYGGYVARKQAHLHKIAMVLSASRGDDLLITKQDLELSLAMLDENETSMDRVFGRIASSLDVGRMNLIVNYLASKGKATKMEVFRHFAMRMSHIEFDIAVESAIRGGYVSQSQTAEGLFLTPLAPAMEFVHKPQRRGGKEERICSPMEAVALSSPANESDS